ncbi:olfactory receptor 5V1 [Xenopus laevis]|uniref:Olfactory receptor n=2 Tax=Xenopus laevis TaxID=8355 RepID=A0A974C9Q0_XENLA|nr:olfactory receptor 5V1 [Xenopus laevis]OCT69112.1 hypothetical protein XELAEV_18040421mg [Xenopus laevis]
MEYSNETSGSSFFLLSLADSPDLKVLYTLTLLILYILTLSVNSLLIVLVRIKPHLQTPMYFFLSNISAVDIGVPSSTIPKLLVITSSQDKSISVFECAAQMYVLSALITTECIMLAIMAYDRYAAICKPLQYHTIMNMRFCIGIAASCWAAGIINSSVHIPYTFKLPYCRSHHIDHFFCEIPPILQLSCKNTWFPRVTVYITAFIVGLCAFLLTIISYVFIISTILKIRSTEGRHKAFSTCASHLIVVSLYYGTLIFMYLLPRTEYFSETDKIMSITYTAVSPLLNPIIYSIRNKDIKLAIRGKPTKKDAISQ